jgi:hypothetical protein
MCDFVQTVNGRAVMLPFILRRERHMKSLLRTMVAATGVAFAAQATAEATFYEHDDYAGRSLNATA